MSKKASKSTEELARQFRTVIPGDRSEPERYHRALDRVYGSVSQSATPQSSPAATSEEEKHG